MFKIYKFMILDFRNDFSEKICKFYEQLQSILILAHWTNQIITDQGH